MKLKYPDKNNCAINMNWTTHTRFRRTAFAILLCLVCSITIQSQAPVPVPSPAADPMVELSISVTDGSGHSVVNVHKEDLQLLVDGTPQPLDYFAKDERPVTCGLLVDASGSVRGLLLRLLDAAKTTVDGLRPVDEAFVERFVGRDNIRIVQGVTSNHRAIVNALDDIYVEGGQTALIDAVASAIKYLDENRPSNPSRRRVLVLVTDGEDRGSRMNAPKTLFALLRNSDVQVFVLGLTKVSSLQSPAAKAIDFLNGTAEQSGGRAFFPKSQSDLTESAEAISRELSRQFVIGYRPGNKSSGREPNIQVKWIGQAETGRKVMVRPNKVAQSQP